MKHLFDILALLSFIFSSQILALPGSYICKLSEEVSLDSTNGVIEVNNLEITFTVPKVNAARESDIKNVRVHYDILGTELIAQATTKKFGELGIVEFDNVTASMTSAGGVDYFLGDSLSGFTAFSLNLPKLAKNMRANEEVELWLTNNLRRIVIISKLECSKN